jgi:hypothetical protein
MRYGKSPWLAAFLNFAVWGSGYLYMGHRRVLGAGLLAVTFVNFFILVTIPSVVLLPTSELFFVWLSFIWAALSLLFAADAYREADQLQKI